MKFNIQTPNALATKAITGAANGILPELAAAIAAWYTYQDKAYVWTLVQEQVTGSLLPSLVTGAVTNVVAGAFGSSGGNGGSKSGKSRKRNRGRRKRNK